MSSTKNLLPPRPTVGTTGIRPADQTRVQQISTRIQAIDWRSVAKEMHTNGYAALPELLKVHECDQLIRDYSDSRAYRKTVVMERYRFGLGEYKYFRYPLPEVIQKIRGQIYPHLAPMANSWFRLLKMDRHFPASHEALLEECRQNGQLKPTPLILKYGEGGHNTLHQDLYGEVYFPMQIVISLSKPEQDFTGGEFVLTQQTPRAQSKAMVLKPGKGDGLLFTTSFRPVKGSKGYYRANVRHGVSEVHSGQRFTLGIIFHDALT